MNRGALFSLHLVLLLLLLVDSSWKIKRNQKETRGWKKAQQIGQHPEECSFDGTLKRCSLLLCVHLKSTSRLHRRRMLRMKQEKGRDSADLAAALMSVIYRLFLRSCSTRICFKCIGLFLIIYVNRGHVQYLIVRCSMLGGQIIPLIKSDWSN